AGLPGPAVITCTISSMLINETDVFRVVTLVDSNTLVGTTITNTARIELLAAPDANEGNNFATATTTVTGATNDLAITKTATSATSPTGATVDKLALISYTVTATNPAPSHARALTISDA